jgi:putative Mg2+ transporter-C (MgtC) family protein
MLEWDATLTRLGLALLFGGIVGFERERKDWAVGIRTHMLACVGSSLVMMVSSFGFSDILGTPNVSLDPSRVASSVIIGIGYLGAGIILVLKPGNIKGLTTASALWTTAGIGLACGGGLYFMAGAATAIMLIVLYGIQEIQKRMFLTTVRHRFRIEVNYADDVNDIIANLSQLPLTLSGINIKKSGGGCRLDVIAIFRGNRDHTAIIREINAMPQVKKVKWN